MMVTGCPVLDSEFVARQNGKRLPCERLAEENDRLREEVHYLKKGDVLHVLTDQELAEQQKHEREMRASIKALDDENAKLREEFDKMDVWHSKELLAAIGENAELRELVRVMAYCMQQGRDCDGCAANGADGVVTAPSGCDWLRDRMRELGVGV